MDNEPKKMKIHPLTATAAVAVILVSMTGIAAMTGILPNFNKPADPVATTSDAVGADAGASQPVSTASTASEPETQAPAPAPIKKSTAKKPVIVASAAAPEAAQVADPTPAVMAPPPPPPPPPCINCGVVESARVIQQQAPASGLGAAAGAVLGGVLGHQVGGGNGKTLATIAGAVGGGFAGNAVEKNAKSSTAYEVVVLMNDGSRQRFVLKEQRWRSGDQVQINNGQIMARNQ